MDGFNSTFSHRGQHHGQRQVPTDVCADILWLRVGFSTRFDAVGVAHVGAGPNMWRFGRFQIADGTWRA